MGAGAGPKTITESDPGIADFTLLQNLINLEESV